MTLLAVLAANSPYEERLRRECKRHLKSLGRLNGHASSILAPGTKSRTYDAMSFVRPIQCAREFARRLIETNAGTPPHKPSTLPGLDLPHEPV